MSWLGLEAYVDVLATKEHRLAAAPLAEAACGVLHVIARALSTEEFEEPRTA
jgi:hypothetical protein